MIRFDDSSIPEYDEVTNPFGGRRRLQGLVCSKLDSSRDILNETYTGEVRYVIEIYIKNTTFKRYSYENVRRVRFIKAPEGIKTESAAINSKAGYYIEVWDEQSVTFDRFAVLGEGLNITLSHVILNGNEYEPVIRYDVEVVTTKTNQFTWVDLLDAINNRPQPIHDNYYNKVLKVRDSSYNRDPDSRYYNVFAFQPMISGNPKFVICCVDSDGSFDDITKPNAPQITIGTVSDILERLKQNNTVPQDVELIIRVYESDFSGYRDFELCTFEQAKNEFIIEI